MWPIDQLNEFSTDKSPLNNSVIVSIITLKIKARKQRVQSTKIPKQTRKWWTQLTVNIVTGVKVEKYIHIINDKKRKQTEEKKICLLIKCLYYVDIILKNY